MGGSTTTRRRSWSTQHVYYILKDHALATGLGTCSASVSPFTLNTNKAGASASLGTWALYVQLHDRLARERGDRDTKHDLRATKRTKYDVGTSTRINNSARGLVDVEDDVETSRSRKFAAQVSAAARSTVPRLLATHERALVCPACQKEFKPSNTVMAKFDNPYAGVRQPQIRCKNKNCMAKLNATRFSEDIP